MEIKVQCPCGARYSFAATTETAAAPVQFVCPACGVDSSDHVNQVIRQQLGLASAASSDPAADAVPSPASTPPPQTCSRHPGQPVVAQCVVCRKAICLKCMAQFGYLCSAYCKGQAEQARIQVPAYAGQRAVIEVRHWQKVRRWAYVVVALGIVLAGAWAWYEFVGSRPRLLTSIAVTPDDAERFCAFVGPGRIVFRNGAQLKGYDLMGRREVWSVELLDEAALARATAVAAARQKAAIEKQQAAQQSQEEAEDDLELGPETTPELPARFTARPATVMAEPPKVTLLRNLRFHVHDRDVWVVQPGKVTRFNGVTGRVETEIPLPGPLQAFVPVEASLLLAARPSARTQWLARIDLATGTAQTAEVPAGAGVGPRFAERPAAQTAAPVAPPTTVWGKALGAARGVRTLAGERNKSIAAAADDAEARVKLSWVDASRTEYIHAGRNVVRLAVRLVEKKVVPAAASKNPSPTNARDEDESLYAVTLQRLLDEPVPDWTGQVIGPPRFFAATTVDVLVAGLFVQVFDKSNQRRWESRLALPVVSDSPCVEHGDGLYLFDQGMLTAFDLASGAVRWRLPAAGAWQVQCDDRGMLYVSTIGAGAALLKVDVRTGRTLWRVEGRGEACHLTEQFVYATETGFDTQDGGRIWRLNPGNGRVIWEYRAPGSWQAPAFRENFFLVRSASEVRVLKFLNF